MGRLLPPNPFFTTATGEPVHLALGLRNPFTFEFQPLSGTLHLNDVGEHAWEEINLGVGRRELWMACD